MDNNKINKKLHKDMTIEEYFKNLDEIMEDPEMSFESVGLYSVLINNLPIGDKEKSKTLGSKSTKDFEEEFEKAWNELKAKGYVE